MTVEKVYLFNALSGGFAVGRRSSRFCHPSLSQRSKVLGHTPSVLAAADRVS